MRERELVRECVCVRERFGERDNQQERDARFNVFSVNLFCLLCQSVVSSVSISFVSISFVFCVLCQPVLCSVSICSALCVVRQVLICYV